MHHDKIKDIKDKMVVVLLIVTSFTLTGFVIDGTYEYHYGTQLNTPMSLTVLNPSAGLTCTPNNLTTGGAIQISANPNQKYDCGSGLILSYIPVKTGTDSVSKRFSSNQVITSAGYLNLIQLIAEYKTDDEDDEVIGKLMAVQLTNTLLPSSTAEIATVQFGNPIVLTKVNHYSDEAEAVIGIALTCLIAASLILIIFWIYEYRTRDAAQHYETVP